MNAIGHGTAMVAKAEPSISEMASLKWDLDVEQRRRLMSILAEELEVLRRMPDRTGVVGLSPSS